MCRYGADGVDSHSSFGDDDLGGGKKSPREGGGLESASHGTCETRFILSGIQSSTYQQVPPAKRQWVSCAPAGPGQMAQGQLLRFG